jgi:hypothetical protein
MTDGKATFLLYLWLAKLLFKHVEPKWQDSLYPVLWYKCLAACMLLPMYTDLVQQSVSSAVIQMLSSLHAFAYVHRFSPAISFQCSFSFMTWLNVRVPSLYVISYAMFVSSNLFPQSVTLLIKYIGLQNQVLIHLLKEGKRRRAGLISKKRTDLVI